ncbi:MAG TPA: hypothetical protein VER04_21160, partial [Polyangiaceae bacterium]|nr:hypothetical protein [Polyangiaceae bacterium]
MMRRFALGLIGLCLTQHARAEEPAMRAFAQRADGTWLNAAQDHVALSRELPSAGSPPSDS